MGAVALEEAGLHGLMELLEHPAHDAVVAGARVAEHPVVIRLEDPEARTELRPHGGLLALAGLAHERIRLLLRGGGGREQQSDREAGGARERPSHGDRCSQSGGAEGDPHAELAARSGAELLAQSRDAVRVDAADHPLHRTLAARIRLEAALPGDSQAAGPVSRIFTVER